MANKSLFKSFAGTLLPKTDAVNEAGGLAYALSPQEALAQYAMTGCLNTTFYASEDTHLTTTLALCEQVEPDFIAKVALVSRREAYMKDLPALLTAVLTVRAPELVPYVFKQVINDGKMVRNFVQIVRSGAAGRKSLGTMPKRLILEWLESKSDDALFKASVGADPSMADIVKMVHPKPASRGRAALYGYLLGKKYEESDLDDTVRSYERFKADPRQPMPDVPFQFLTGIELTGDHWREIARNASWQMTRMNLNTFLRHGVFKSAEIVKLVAARLRDEQAIAKARVFPYQLLVAYASSGEELPQDIREALQDAMEIAVRNVPVVEGKVAVFPDVSGSMISPATGYRKGSTSAVRCIDVAALVAAAILRKNPSAELIPFEQEVVQITLNPRDSIMTNAQKLAALGGGGTNCSAPLAKLNAKKSMLDVAIFVSDNESWVDSRGQRGTQTLNEWRKLKERNPKAKLVCIDVQPNTTTQARNEADVLNVGGFSDHVFTLVEKFAKGELDGRHWVKLIESQPLAH